MTTSRWKCPLCGQHGKQTKEHVWPKWLRDAPMVKELLGSAHGERFHYEFSDLERADERLVEVQRSVNVAKWVPQITAPVCTSCNSGWMSRLESRVKRTLGPVVLTEEQSAIDGAGVRDLARWAVKTAMTYQVALKMQQGCFTPTEVRRMATDQEIPSRCKVWIRSMPGPFQWIATQYKGLVMPDSPHLGKLTLRDNLALALVGIPHLVLVVGVVPESEDLWLLDSLLPHSFGTGVAPQIWPNPGRLDLPTTDLESEFDPRTLFDVLSTLGSVTAPSLAELTPEALSALLLKDHRPSALLQTVIDQFVADCDSEVLATDSPSEILFGSDARLVPKQLSQLFEGALTLISKHADSRPREVARRLHNLANVFFASEAHPACVLLAIACASVPEGGYAGRPDIYALAGHAAWKIAAFGLAADMYEAQVALEPESQLGQFNLAESAFMSGDFARAADIVSHLIAEEGVPLGDTLACLRVTLGLVVGELDLTSFDGFSGPTAEDVFEMVMIGKAPTYESASSFRDALLALLEELKEVDPVSIFIAKAYLTDSVADWAAAATALLQNPTHPELNAVLRKGASCGQAFEDAFQAQIEARGCPTSLPDGADAVEFIRAHAYPRHHRTVRLLDEDYKVLQVL